MVRISEIYSNFRTFTKISNEMRFVSISKFPEFCGGMENELTFSLFTKNTRKLNQNFRYESRISAIGKKRQMIATLLCLAKAWMR